MKETYYYHYIPFEYLPEGDSPTLKELTDAVAGEIESEGNFGKAKSLHVTSARSVTIEREAYWRCRVSGWPPDVKIIRANLRYEYKRLTPAKLTYNETRITK